MTSPKRILVVDDSGTVTTLLATALRGSGYEVTTADNGPDGYTLGKEETFDLVILDQLMPGMLGIEVIAKWQEEGVENDVLVLTGVDDERVDSDWARLGADQLLKKPFQMPELLQIVSSRLAD